MALRAFGNDRDGVWARRERRRLRPSTVVLWVVLVVFGLAAYELGRGFLQAQQAAEFIARLPRATPPEVKAQVEAFARRLHDYNFLVRNSAMVAMKTATRQNLGSDPSAWVAWWAEHGEGWTYRPEPGPTNAVPADSH